MSEGVTEDESEIQREWLHASVDYIPEWAALTYDDQVPAHMKTKYLTWTISKENQTYEHLLDNFEHEHVYLDRVWKNGTPGAKDKKWPWDCRDVDDGMLIPWLKMDWKMDTVGSWNGEWKFGKKILYIVVGPTLPPHLYLLQ